MRERWKNHHEEFDLLQFLKKRQNEKRMRGGLSNVEFKIRACLRQLPALFLVFMIFSKNFLISEKKEQQISLNIENCDVCKQVGLVWWSLRTAVDNWLYNDYAKQNKERQREREINLLGDEPTDTNAHTFMF